MPTEFTISNNYDYSYARSPTAIVVFGDPQTGNISHSVDDGATWVIRQSPFEATQTTEGHVSLAWNGSYFMAVQTHPTIPTRYAKSVDGITWVIGTLPNQPNNNSWGTPLLAYDPAANRWAIALNRWPAEILTSTNDGATWSTSIITESEPLTLIHDGVRFCLTTTPANGVNSWNETPFLVSTDGTTWTQVGVIDREYGLHNGPMLFNGTTYFACSKTGGCASSSNGGATWTNATFEGSSYSVYSGGVIGGNFVVCDYNMTEDPWLLAGTTPTTFVRTSAPGAMLYWLAGSPGRSVGSQDVMFLAGTVENGENCMLTILR